MQIMMKTFPMYDYDYNQVLEEGRRLAAASNPEQQQDIRVQMKLLSERSNLIIL